MTQNQQSPDLAAIRERWAGIDWRYAQNSLSETYIGDAWIYQAGAEYRDSKTLIDLDEPKEYEVAFLKLATDAPGDIRALLAEVERLRGALTQAGRMKTIKGARRIVADALLGEE